MIPDEIYPLNAPHEPEGYQPLSAKQRSDWNGFLDHVASQPNLDLSSPKTGLNLLAKYSKKNPGFSVTPEMIPSIHYDQRQIRTGDKFGDLDKNQLNYLRAGLPSSYLNKSLGESNGAITPELSKLYYPQSGEHGTDIEGYYRTKMGLVPVREIPEISANKPSTVRPIPITTPIENKANSDMIPKPNYSDSASRLGYLKQWAKKYGDLEGRGDHILKLNEIPRTGKDTTENMAKKIGAQYGIDPALLSESAMEEGMSELFKDKSGLDTKRRKPTDFGYMGDYGNKEFPINGNNSMGLPDFAKRFPELVAGGYLPKSFRNKFQGTAESAENNFKTVEDAMQAKAALFKYGQDYVDKLAKKHGIPLSDTARQFFTLAFFNGGEGGVLNRLVPYAQKGLLKDDKFLAERPEMEKGKPDNLDVYGHVTRRIKMANALKKEGFFQ